MKKYDNKEKKFYKFQSKTGAFIMALVVGIVLSGCNTASQQNMEQMEVTEDGTNSSYIRKKADSLDEAVISKINES